MKEKILRQLPRKFRKRDVLTTAQASALSSIHERSLQRYAVTGKVPAIKIKPNSRARRAWRFPKIDFESWIAARDVRRADLDQRRRVKKSADA